MSRAAGYLVRVPRSGNNTRQHQAQPPEDLEDQPASDLDASLPSSSEAIRYRAEFLGEHDRTVVHSITQSEPLQEPNEAHDSPDADGSGSRPVFDAVTMYTCKMVSGTSGIPGYAEHLGAHVRMELSSLQGQRRIDVFSEYLVHAIRSVVSYWPALNLVSGSQLSIPEPYSLLVQYSEQLNDYAATCVPDDNGRICEKKMLVKEHWQMAQKYLDENIMAAVFRERERHERGFATFEHLWLLFKPGTDVIAMASTIGAKFVAPFRRGYVVDNMERRNDGKQWKYILWSLEYDGSCVGIVEREYFLDAFEGEVKISALPIVPADRLDHKDDQKTWTETLRANGKKAFDLLKPICMTHTGPVMEAPFAEANGLVVVDMKTFYADPDSPRPLLRPPTIQGSGMAACRCSVCKESVQHAEDVPASPMLFEGYDNIDVGTSVLTEHQSFLFPSLVIALHFRSRAWKVLDVANLGPAQFQPDILNTLVMSDKRIKMLKALSKNFMIPADGDAHIEPHKGFWSADFIKGKGKSEIILLHGRPGVGKTYTAECMAEHTRRPLLVLTCADIGTDPEQVEGNLETYFQMAKSWGALVLIDEADIYMERRANNDLDRNSLVATFLRALESFEGMLFLTTNRVGAFDDAFVSRIHVKLYYPPLRNEDRQKIWTSFVNKLTRERRNEIYVTREAKDYIKGKTIRELDLNGREIRNAFQTAVALAEYDQHRDDEGLILVEDSHIEQVAEMTQEFQEYLTKLHEANEAKRAARVFDRLDAKE